ncbi:MAG: pyridoxamine kinase [Bacilli bacterium]|nr:pyridoxamine kinase [Bacilli bacterium]
MRTQRILTIQDFSCMGRCSLTVALPTISACGIEAVSIPTAVLSNHTAFKSWTYLDMTKEMEPIVDHWMDYRHAFDYIYTGYLSNGQIGEVRKIIDRLKTEDTKTVIDPAMADNGKLYPGFDEKHVEDMKLLFDGADVVLPNLTEACLLTGTKMPEQNPDLSFYQDLLDKVLALHTKAAVITGVELHPGKVGLLLEEENSDTVFFYETEKYPGKYHGTGDLFASALVGVLDNGFALPQALKIAHDYVHVAIQKTVESKQDGMICGPCFEEAIPSLVDALRKAKEEREN